MNRQSLFLLFIILFSPIVYSFSESTAIRFHNTSSLSPMDISSILYNLTPFKELLNPIEELAAKEYKQGLTQELYQSYDFIEMRLYEVPDSGSYQRLHSKCVFKIEQGGTIELEEVYCENKKTHHDIEQYIKLYTHKHKLLWSKETPAAQVGMYYGHQLEALLTADQIAKEGYMCDHSYSPGYYGEIYVKEHRIELYQVNRRNARSIDHKDNYYMRDVKFIIPLSQTGLPEQLRYDYKIDN